MDWSFDSIGQIVGQGVGIYGQYQDNKTANDIAKEQANMAWETNATNNAIKLSNAKLMLVGGVILAIGTAFFIFFRK